MAERGGRGTRIAARAVRVLLRGVRVVLPREGATAAWVGLREWGLGGDREPPPERTVAMGRGDRQGEREAARRSK